MSNQETGKKGEDKACSWLVKSEYDIIERNYRVREGEIDIIAVKTKTILFAEVKTRNSSSYGTANQGFPKRRVGRLFSASLVFISRNEKYAEFDREFKLITIDGDRLRMIQIEHD